MKYYEKLNNSSKGYNLEVDFVDILNFPQINLSRRHRRLLYYLLTCCLPLSFKEANRYG
jgi:hypothetical protein